MKNPDTLSAIIKEEGLEDAREIGREMAIALASDDTISWDALAEDEEMMSLYESGLLVI